MEISDDGKGAEDIWWALFIGRLDRGVSQGSKAEMVRWLSAGKGYCGYDVLVRCNLPSPVWPRDHMANLHTCSLGTSQSIDLLLQTPAPATQLHSFQPYVHQFIKHLVWSTDSRSSFLSRFHALYLAFGKVKTKPISWLIANESLSTLSGQSSWTMSLWAHTEMGL